MTTTTQGISDHIPESVAWHTFESIMFDSWANDTTLTKAADHELREIAYNVIRLGVRPAVALVKAVNELEDLGYVVVCDDGFVDITEAGCWAIGL